MYQFTDEVETIPIFGPSAPAEPEEGEQADG